MAEMQAQAADGVANGMSQANAQSTEARQPTQSAAHDAIDAIAERIRAAHASRTPLRIAGAGTKALESRPAEADLVPTAGTLDATALVAPPLHEPTELVVTAAAGMRLDALETLLAASRQRLAFEPPRFGKSGAGGRGGTVGGMVASGLAGPSRMAAGSLRDHLLGATLVDGRGQVLRFGGRVIKNVAGYDVARALAGSRGALGVIAEVSLKVLPLPQAVATLRFESAQGEALARLGGWGRQPLPLDASAWWSGALVIRLSGAEAAVASACTRLGGERVPADAATAFWDGLRDRTDAYFETAHRTVDAAVGAAGPGLRLFRVAVPPNAPVLDLPGDTLVEWHGGQRWLLTDRPVAVVRAAAADAGGHATIVRGARAGEPPETPLAASARAIQARLKVAFDPHRILNPGVLGAGL
jgi:glycolate oxidase FAD binding subunit